MCVCERGVFPLQPGHVAQWLAGPMADPGVASSISAQVLYFCGV